MSLGEERTWKSPGLSRRSKVAIEPSYLCRLVTNIDLVGCTDRGTGTCPQDGCPLLSPKGRTKIQIPFQITGTEQGAQSKLDHPNSNF